ncbi:hypothetical protein VCHA40P242_10463 [Vibrio chagasii]|nr:hypothetical protein VCHA36P164_30084 [Vibrio chagasii]CAH7026755.1 hypothetical protein VCHA40P242_10463 [Vibrio chagasii]
MFGGQVTTTDEFFILITIDLSTTSHFIVIILIERGAFYVPSKVSRETL